MKKAVESKLDIEDAIYESKAGPITVRDAIFGFAAEIERSGHDFYAHKTGFTMKSLYGILRSAGFNFVYGRVAALEIVAIAFKQEPTAAASKLFALPDSPGVN